MRKLFLTCIFLASSIFAYSQDSNKPKQLEEDCKTWQGLLIDVGFNQYQDAPKSLELNNWKSKGVNMYYYFGIPFGCSKFNLATGIGLGLDSYHFKDESVRLFTSNDSLTIINSQISGATGLDYQKSKLATNYVDIPLELRFQTGECMGKKFRIAVGGKVGVLFNAHTKTKYTNIGTDDKTKEKLHQEFGLNKFRYGVTGRVGFGYVNLFGYYSLSDLFDSELGPKATPFMLGLSFSPSFFFDF